MKKRILISFIAISFAFLYSRFGVEINTLIKVQVLRGGEKEIQYSIAQRYKYEIIEQETEPIYLKPEEVKELTLTLKNVGKSEWDLRKNAKNQFILGTYLPRKRESVFYDESLSEWLNAARIYIEDESGKNIIIPEETTTFKFQIKAPETPGVYRENFAPLVEGLKGVNNVIITYDIVVEGNFSSGYDYEIIEKQDKKTMALNSTKTLDIKVKNTGKVPWYSQSPFPVELIVDESSSAPLFQARQTAMTGRLEVRPEEIAVFSFDITAPDEAGSYEVGMKLAVEDLFIFTSEAITWNVEVTKKMVALTFDDGYGDINAFIDVLNEEGVRGTFFMLGCVAQSRPDEMERIVEEGHLLANHSYDHPDFRTLGTDSIRWQLSITRDIMKETAGLDVYPYFRYPYGARNSFSDSILAEEGWKYFHWTNGTGDYKFHPNTAHGREHVYYFATLNPPDHAIVLTHIISRSTLAVLPDIIDWYRENDYAFVTVDELE